MYSKYTHLPEPVNCKMAPIAQNMVKSCLKCSSLILKIIAIPDHRNNESNAMSDDPSKDKFDEASGYGPSISGSKKTATSLLTIEEDAVFNIVFFKLAHSSKPINMKEVVNDEPRLRQLKTRFTNRQLADRVRTLRKAILWTRSKNNLKKRNNK